MQHTFFVNFFAVVLHDHNVKLPETSSLHVLWRKCRTCSCSHFFSLPLIFTLIRWPLAFFIFSPPLQTCHTGLPTKKCLLYCLSVALDLCRPFSRLASPACRLLSLFICLSLALYSKFVDMTISLSLILILQKTRVQEQFPLSVFVFIDSLVVSALHDSGDYAISRQNNLELHLGRHPCLLSYFTLVCLWCGRKVGRCTVT